MSAIAAIVCAFMIGGWMKEHPDLDLWQFLTCIGAIMGCFLVAGIVHRLAECPPSNSSEAEDE